MKKTIDFSKTVFELVKEDAQIAEIMKEIGFENIANPAMLKSVGCFMTIPKGAAMKGIDLNRIRKTFREKGYQVLEEEGKK